MSEKDKITRLPPKPESDLAYKALRKAAQGDLTEAEFSRIEAAVRRIDCYIDNIRRNRRIKRDIQHLINKGKKVEESIFEIAERYHISDERIAAIWYEKRNL